MLIANLNKKIVFSIFVVFILWLSGIIITPMLAGGDGSIGQKISAFMYFFYKPVCHQMFDRSFLIEGYTLAVCVRCFGFYLAGFLVASNYLVKKKINMWRMSGYILYVLPALLDFLLEKINIYTNIFEFRLITGFLLGVAVFQLLFVSLFISKPNQKVETIT